MNELSDREIINRLGTSKQVADYYGVTVQAVTNWRRRGLPVLLKKIILQNRSKLLK